MATEQELYALKIDFESKWQRLKNGLDLINDGVYSETELDLETMKQEVKEAHALLNDNDIAITKLK